MNSLKIPLGSAALALLLALAFTPSADARTPTLERSGSAHFHHRPGYGHWPGHGPRYYRGPRHRGPRISIGFIAPVLPVGYVRMAVGGHPYYYHGGYYYRPTPGGYVVVDAPLGAQVLTLPASAVRVEIGGFTYYRYDNAYYQWQPARNAYVVVPAPAPAAVQHRYKAGDVVETLPTGYSAEVINGVQYYRFGSDYFMPTQRDGREVFVVVRL